MNYHNLNFTGECYFQVFGLCSNLFTSICLIFAKTEAKVTFRSTRSDITADGKSVLFVRSVGDFFV